MRQNKRDRHRERRARDEQYAEINANILATDHLLGPWVVFTTAERSAAVWRIERRAFDIGKLAHVFDRIVMYDYEPHSFGRDTYAWIANACRGIAYDADPLGNS